MSIFARRVLELPAVLEPESLYFVADNGDETLCDAFVVGSDGDARKIKGAAGSPAWNDVTGKPTFATVATSGSYGDLSGRPTLGTAAAQNSTAFATAAQGALAGTALQPGAQIPWTDVTGKPAFFSGAYGDLTGIPSTFTPAAHNQAWSTITTTPTTLAGYGISDAATAAQGALAASASQPGHTHAQSDVTGLVADLAGKAATVHGHVIADTTGLQAALDGRQPLATVLTNTTAAYTTAQETKLAGIAAGATVNSADATLLARANHTGTQLASTVSDFAASARAQVEATVLAGANITLTPAGSGATRTITIEAAGGGGGSPGGTTGQLQFNNAGAFDGAANVGIEGGNLRLAATTDPSPPTGAVLLYSRLVAGFRFPRFIGEAGIATSLQTALHDEAVVLISPTNTTSAPSIIGGTLTTIATMSRQQAIGSTNLWLSTERKRFATSATAGNTSGMRLPYTKWFRGSAPGFGGVWFRGQFGLGTNLNGGQVFIGLCASVAALAGQPSALTQMFGIGYDSTDASTGNWQFMRNDGSGAAVKVDLGPNAPRNTTDGLDLIMFLPPGEAELFVRIVNIRTGVTVLETGYTTELPVVNTGLAFKHEVRNGAVAALDSIDFASVYIGRRP